MSTNFVLTLTLIQLFIDSRSIDKRVGVFPGKMCSDEVLEGKFRNLNFSPFTKKTTENCFKLFLSIYRYQIFFSSYKFQHCQTIVLLNKLRLLSNPLFHKRRSSYDFPPRNTLVAEKHRAPEEKIAFSTPPPPSGWLWTPLPLLQCLYGWAYAYVTAEISPSIVYEICLPMVLMVLSFHQCFAGEITGLRSNLCYLFFS